MLSTLNQNQDLWIIHKILVSIIPFHKSSYIIIHNQCSLPPTNHNIYITLFKFSSQFLWKLITCSQLLDKQNHHYHYTYICVKSITPSKSFPLLDHFDNYNHYFSTINLNTNNNNMPYTIINTILHNFISKNMILCFS